MTGFEIFDDGERGVLEVIEWNAVAGLHHGLEKVMCMTRWDDRG